MTNHYSNKKLFNSSDLIGQTVTIKGWVRSRRDSKAGFSFIALHDGSSFDPIQAIVPNTVSNYNDEVLKLTKDCSISVTGKLIASQGKGQKVEIQAETIEVYGWVDSPETYPVSPKRHTMEHLREVAHLRARTNIIGAIARVRNQLANAIHNFLCEKEFMWVNTPILTSNDCEGAGELFRVSTLDSLNPPLNEQGKVDFKKDFFGNETFLTVSGQLNVESYCCALSKVYTFGPTFRAENSNTSRHLAEFWMVEPEIAFADLNEDADLAEEMLKSVIQTVVEKCSDDLNFFDQFIQKGLLDKLQSVVDKGFVRVQYTKAVEILKQSGQKFEYPVEWGIDLQSEHERFLCEKHFNAPVVIMNYPKDIKAFYMRLNDDGKTVAAMDVLVPGIGEIIGGSQREERLEVLDQRIAEMNIDASGLSWYRDLRRYGSVPHSGFGLGFERLLGYITGVPNIRELIPFPRTPGNAKF
ncbi:asparagine--tRNA ligase [Francisellaceae bacterium CB300]